MNLLFSTKGRIGRGVWWVSRLTILAIIIAIVVLLFILQDENGEFQSNSSKTVFGFVALAAFSISFWIGIVTTIKRYHDRGKVGLWILLVFVPYIGALWQIVECGFLAGDEGDNKYGPAPNALKTSATKTDVIKQAIAPEDDTFIKIKPRPFEYDLRPTIKTGRVREYSPTSPRKP